MMDYTEAIRVEFATAHHSFESVLGAFLAAQGSQAFSRCSSSRQYRSAIWYTDAAQREAAEKAIILHCQRFGKARADFKIDVEQLGEFYAAEDYHQHYTAKMHGHIKSRAAAE
jgi:peptide methionine sulfoxide reductase MsrA